MMKRYINLFKERMSTKVSEAALKPFKKNLLDINALEIHYEEKTSAELESAFKKIKSQIVQEPISEVLRNTFFALTREVCRRKLDMKPFDVQIIAALILEQGKLAEMKTGEGKTLVAVLPVSFTALQGRRVHVLTFNDYLAKRDALWMKPVYDFFELSVAYIQEGMSVLEKKKAYQSDIVYGTAKEVGFDLLRDGLAYTPEARVLQAFDYCIIDEADAVLLDEARNPLVIAGNLIDHEIDLVKIKKCADQLLLDEHYELDEYKRNLFLNENGIAFTERYFSTGNLHEADNRILLTAINLALQAKELLTRNKDYLVQNGCIKIIDEFTGRVVEDRRWQNGLQKALEVKEGLSIQSEGEILGTITLPHLIKKYEKVAAMTATAIDAYLHFENLYGLQVIQVPPNKTECRIDLPDEVFLTKQSKTNAIIEKVLALKSINRPVLIGTSTVEESEKLASLLRQKGVQLEVLNARNEAEEAKIIANAGKWGSVTISTNMAGRGTDILLGGEKGLKRSEILALGGLFVLGTNHYESQRIDKQLRGRAGRQGDPGNTCFYSSFEDHLLLKYNFNSLFPKSLELEQLAEPISNKTVLHRKNLIQEIIEGQMFEVMEMLSRYHDFVENQRILFQRERIEILERFTNPQKDFLLSKMDLLWAEHLSAIAGIKEGVNLVRLRGGDPLDVFQQGVHTSYMQVQSRWQTLMEELSSGQHFDKVEKTVRRPSSTWTYVINDDDFGNQLALKIGGNMSLQLDFGMAPVLFTLGLKELWSRYWKRRG